MRAKALALVFLAACAALGWIAWSERGVERRSAVLELPGAASRPSDARGPDQPPVAAANDARPSGPAHLSAVASPVVPASTTANAAARVAVDGVVRDRLGAPLEDERVWLLDADAPFPDANARLIDFITARTGKEGRFSLVVPHPGPWRIAVGAPGEPRCEPSVARRLERSARVEATVSGTSAVRVTFDGLPPASTDITLELVALLDPDAARPRGGRARAAQPEVPDGADGGRPRNGAGRGTPEAGARPRNRAARRGGEAEPGAGDATGGGPDQRGAALAAPPSEASPGPALARLASAQEPTPPAATGPATGPAAGAGQRGRRGRAGRGDSVDGSDPDGAEDLAPAGPPAEVWRRLERRALSAEDRAAGTLDWTGLSPGATVRLALRIDGATVEGQTRFLLVADTRIEVRVFALDPPTGGVALGASLGYVAVPRPLAADERPPGVRWAD